jgi:hypothetical protein
VASPVLSQLLNGVLNTLKLLLLASRPAPTHTHITLSAAAQLLPDTKFSSNSACRWFVAAHVPGAALISQPVLQG